MITYYDYNVLEAAKNRIKYVFDEFKNIIVSISSGKDSSVLFYLCYEEAKKRNKKINLFFLDQEIEYQSTIDLMKYMMNLPNINPLWYQIPIYMTNSTSYFKNLIYCWGEKENWIRNKEKIAIKEIKKEYPKRFYKFFNWFEKEQKEKTAFMIGLRSKESLNRFRAVTTNEGYKDIKWSTKTTSDKSFRFYPLYDWCFGDIWKYIDDNNIKYNKVYDRMYIKNGVNISTIRVSNLMHEKSFKCLIDLQEFEPDTYNKIIKRVPGIHCASIYCKEHSIYNNIKLPKYFNNWLDYRNHLLETLPFKSYNIFIKRFKKQENTDFIYKQQVKQLLINDLENNIPIITKNKNTQIFLEKWKKIL